MARPKTSAEHKRELARDRKRRQRERERAERRNRPLLSDVAHPYISGSFADFLADKSLLMDEALDAGGITIRGDLATEDHAGVYPEKTEWEDIFDVPLNSLNRATVMIDAMLDAARELAGQVNAFKLHELDQRIAEAEARNASIAEIEALHQIKKRYRRTRQPRIPVYWVRSN